MSVYLRGSRANRNHLAWSIERSAMEETELRTTGNPDDPNDPDTIRADELQNRRLRLELRYQNIIDGRQPDTRTAELFPDLLDTDDQVVHDHPAPLEPVAAQGGLF